MLSAASFAVLSFAAAVSAAPGLASRDTDCADFHIFLARGNNEPYPGRQQAIVEAVCDGVASCDYEDLHYSALATDEYCISAYNGVVAGFTQMAAYANRCPNSKFILSGYSQGAQIVTDILGGGGGVLFNGCVQPDTPAMSRDTAPGNMIAAAIVFGDTRHAGGQSYNYGNGSAFDGYYPRTPAMLSAIDNYSSVLRNWCLDTDPLCAANQPTANSYSHLSYFIAFSAQAGEWIQSVAGIVKNDPSFTTSIATGVSGYAQDYATIGTATPSGLAPIDATWTLHTAVTATPTATGKSSTKTSAKSSSAAAASSTAASSVASSTAASSTSSAAATSSSSSSTSSSATKSSTSSTTTTTTVVGSAGGASKNGTSTSAAGSASSSAVVSQVSTASANVMVGTCTASMLIAGAFAMFYAL